MNIAEQFEKLQVLYESGALTADEFAEAKRKVLAERDTPPLSSNPKFENLPFMEDDSLGRAANRYVSWQMITSIIGLIIGALFFFCIWLPGFRSVNGQLPF